MKAYGLTQEFSAIYTGTERTRGALLSALEGGVHLAPSLRIAESGAGRHQSLDELLQ